MWKSLADLCQSSKAWKEGQPWECGCRDVEASHLRDGCPWTCHTSDDRLTISQMRSSCPTREGHEQDGQAHHPSEGPSDRTHRLSPINIQRHIVLDEETPADVMAKSWQEAEKWERSEIDAAKHHKEAVDWLIQAATEVVEFTKANNLLRQEIINAENELSRTVQDKNSCYCIQKAGLNTEACLTSCKGNLTCAPEHLCWSVQVREYCPTPHTHGPEWGL